MILLSTFVAGRPITQGSLRPVAGRGRRKGTTVLVPDGKRGTLKGWRSAIGWEALAAMRTQPDKGPVCIELQFFLALGQRADLDKLSRAVLDALTGIAYVDDVQVVGLHATKQETHAVPGVQVTVREA